LLERLAESAPMSSITEFDLAVDARSEITDQNHIGGALSTLRLAARANVRAADRVLDLGCGLGGPARLLAEVCGCTAHGIDANPTRISEADELARLVHLSERVSFACADMTARRFDGEFTVVWGQNAWLHVDRPDVLASVAASALGPGGRIAFEDVCLKKPPSGEAEDRLLSTLCEVWGCALRPIDDWARAFRDHGCVVGMPEDEHALLVRYLTRAELVSNRSPGRWPEHEVVGWRHALALATAGVIGYFRLVATKPANA
jgi:SAM-dependent methyltransferase